MDLLLWQLADSGFPAGGFAHSAGLEAAVQHGEVFGWKELERFTRDVIRQAGRNMLPLVSAAHAERGDLAELDALCDVFLSNPVANRASRAQGRAFLTACVRSFPENPVRDLQEAMTRQRVFGHYAPLFGAALRALDVGRPSAQRLFLFLTSRAVTSASVRLGLVGTYEAQRLQTTMASQIDRTLELCAQRRPLEIAQTVPLVDLFQSTHDRLYSRLFQS